MFLLWNLKVPLPHTLRCLVCHKLIKALKISEQRVDFVLDTYNPPCLKDITRDIQDYDLDDSDEVYSFGSGEKTTFNFLSLLKHSNFKTFLNKLKKSEEIQKNKYANIYCSVDNGWICLQCDEGVLQMEDVHDFYGTHDEFDTHVVF